MWKSGHLFFFVDSCSDISLIIIIIIIFFLIVSFLQLVKKIVSCPGNLKVHNATVLIVVLFLSVL